MCSLHNYSYRIGSAVISVTAPAFTETALLGKFRCRAPEKADLTVRIVPCGSIKEPEGAFRLCGCEEHYAAGGTVVRNTATKEILWKAVRDQGGFVRIEMTRELLPVLNTFTVTEMLDLPSFFLSRGSVILHASFIEKNGKAVLFTAPKQTGKSTQARLWQEHENAAVINGDRALLEKRGGIWHASGIPFCGTSGICENLSYPLAAVILLSQGRENTLTEASPRETAFGLLNGGSFDSGDPAQLERVLDIADSLAAEVPFYHFACLPDASAVRVLKNKLFDREGI